MKIHIVQRFMGSGPKRALGILGLSVVLLGFWYVSLCVLPVDDIREAVIRYQLVHRGTDTSFFSIDGNDPSEKILRRFQQGPLKVRGATGCCELRPEPPLLVTDPKTGEQKAIEGGTKFLYDKKAGARTVHFFIGRITPSGFWSVKVSGGSYCGELCASGGHYLVVRRWSHWEVVDYVEDWVA